MVNDLGRTPRRLQVAVAGAGLIGRRHIDLVRADERCSLAAIVDPAAPAAELARDLGVPWHRSLEELFEQNRPDAVILATPNRLHVEQGLAAVEARVPVLVEKPVADDVAEAWRLVVAAEESGVPLLVGHHRRHNMLLAAARDTVRSGKLGDPVAVMGSALYYKPDDYFDEGPWRRRAGGGPILVNMIHEVDDLRFICGDFEWVHAVASNHTRGFEVEDTVAISFGMRDGVLGTFLLSDAAVSARSWELTSGENPSYPHHPDEDCYVVAGTRGSLSVPTMRLRRATGPSSWWIPTEDTVIDVRRNDPLAAQLRHFCDVIRHGVRPLVDGRDAIETLRVTQAIARSAAEGRRIECGPASTSV